jgi:hypothetical protein
MTTEEINGVEPLEDAPYRAIHFEWVLPTFLRPKHALAEIALQERAVWLAPLLVLTVLVLINVLAGGPARAAGTQGAQLNSEYMQYYTPEQLAQFEQSANQTKGPLFIYIFPAIQAILGTWVFWLLLGSLLHLSLTMSGSRSPNVMTLNLAAWACLPLGIRSLVQAGYSLFTHQVIRSPGLSGLIPSGAKGFEAFLSSFLSQIDIYMIWVIVLLMVGITLSSKLARGKAWAATLISVILIMSLSALPAFIGAQLGGLSGGSGYIPFF